MLAFNNLRSPLRLSYDELVIFIDWFSDTEFLEFRKILATTANQYTQESLSNDKYKKC